MRLALFLINKNMLNRYNLNIGLSTDTKPTLHSRSGSVLFFETDTHDVYVWDGAAWKYASFISTVEQYSVATNVIQTEHARIHAGEGYTVTAKFTGVANGASKDILLSNPAANFPHLRIYSVESEKAPANIILYEGATVSADGTALTIFNNNRGSSNTAGMTAFHGPTITDIGTDIEHSFIAGSKQVGGSFSDFSYEWLLKANTKYIVRYTNNSGQTSEVNFKLFWYEV